MNHGVRVHEIPTGVRPPVSVTAGLTVAVGTMPLNLGSSKNFNKPVIVYTLAEAVDKMGYLDDGALWEDYTLLEVVKSHFALYGVAPLVLVNVLDPEHHRGAANEQEHKLDADGQVTIDKFGILLDSVVVKVGEVTKVLDEDYTLAFDRNGFVVVSRVEDGSIAAEATVKVDYSYLKPDEVDVSDIIGGYEGGKYSGLEVVEQVFPATGLVPGFIIAPKWSQDPEVAARMAKISQSIDDQFGCMAVVDLTTDPGEAEDYSEVPAWKSLNGINSPSQIACWAKVKFGDDTYHLSTHLASLANVIDALHDGIPYASPSNKQLAQAAMVLDGGAEVLLTKGQANYLNGQGVVTVLNGKLWGNRTACYPQNTDVKDNFIPLRRMFKWISNTIILTIERDVDEPGNRRMIDNVVGTIQIWLNGLIAQGALIDGLIEFREADNTVSDLSDGKYQFHMNITPPSPAESIEFKIGYDASALAALFGG